PIASAHPSPPLLSCLLSRILLTSLPLCILTSSLIISVTPLTPLESALPRPPSRKPFTICTYKTPSEVRILKDLRPPDFARNPFIPRTYGTPWEVRETQEL